jgi:hypothetical protein
LRAPVDNHRKQTRIADSSESENELCDLIDD